MDNLFVNPRMTRGTNDSYYLMYKNSVAGILSYDFISDKFSFESNKDYKEMTPFPIMLIYSDEQLKEKWDSIIRNWIDDRVIQKNRPETKEILKHLGLSHYNQWDICRKNLAMSIEDFFWISKRKCIDYKDVSLRYNLLNGTEPLYQAPFPIVTYLSQVEYLNEQLKKLDTLNMEDKNKLKLNLQEILLLYNYIKKHEDKKYERDELISKIENSYEEYKKADVTKITTEFSPDKFYYFSNLYSTNKKDIDKIIYKFIYNLYNIDNYLEDKAKNNIDGNIDNSNEEKFFFVDYDYRNYKKTNELHIKKEKKDKGSDNIISTT